MLRKWRCSFITVFLLAMLMLTGCSRSEAPQKMETGSNPDLTAHTAEFKPEIIKVTEGVYVAIGFGLANSILLVGQDGIVIVDAMESAEAALPVKEAGRPSSNPIGVTTINIKYL